MSEKDYRATYLTSLGILSKRTDIVDVHADVIDLDKMRNWLLVTPSSKITNRDQIWEFLLGIIPHYKTVRLHTQEQLEEQWSVLGNAAYLILSVGPDHDSTQYLLALHLIQTGQLKILGNDTEEICSGNPDGDKADLLLIRNILPFFKARKLREQYFIVHELMVLLASLNRHDSVVHEIYTQIGRTDTHLANKLRNAEIKKVLSMLVRTCFVNALPTCCFGKLFDRVIASRAATALVKVGVESILKNAVIYRNSAVSDLAEEIKSTRLVTQPHQTCLS